MRKNQLVITNQLYANMLNMGPLASTDKDISCTSTWDAGCGFRPFVVQILCLIIIDVKLKVNKENTRKISNIKRASCFMICRQKRYII